MAEAVVRTVDEVLKIDLTLSLVKDVKQLGTVF